MSGIHTRTIIFITLFQDQPVRKGAKRIASGQSSPGICQRCLHSLKYLILILLIPPFLNYTALQQEGSALLGDGKEVMT